LRRLEGVCAFVRRYAAAPDGGAAPAVKVVFSFRSAFFERALNALGHRGNGDEVSALFPLETFFTREVVRDGRRQQSYRMGVGRGGGGELYEAYRAFAGTKDESGAVRRFRPLTAFGELSLAAGAVAAFDPLFEYLLSEDVLREAGGWEGVTGEGLAALLAEG